MSASSSITGLILAGGESRRMGGEDKGWLNLNGSPLVQRVISRIQPQVSRIVISANRNLDHYKDLGYPVIADTTPYQGPLAGIATGLNAIETDYALVVPTDAPLIPNDLVKQLVHFIPARLILCEDESRLQPLFGLYHCTLKQSINTYLSQGQRKLTRWCQLQNPQIVTISDTKAFTNLNTPADLAIFEKNLPN